MTITVESIGLLDLKAVIGGKTELEFKGGTVSDLVDQLAGRFGAGDRKTLLDREGRLDPTIQVMVNEEGFLAREGYSKRALQDGDRIRFVLLVDGG